LHWLTKKYVVSATPVIDAIEGDGWRQEIRRELLCKLQQKLLLTAEASAYVSSLCAMAI
jgi:hypothetical protein